MAPKIGKGGNNLNDYSFKFPDTGQVDCYDREGKITKPVKKDDYYGQDGCFTNNPMSFVKLNKKGDIISDSFFWQEGLRAVKDKNTGLIWEVKSPEAGDVNYSQKKYNWRDSKNRYLERLNQESYAGRNDWRIPNRDELKSIISYDRENPALDSWYFPYTNNGLYWTSFTYEMQPNFAYVVSMGLGAATAISKKSKLSVRAVAGGRERLFGQPDRERFVDNGDGTITDRVLKLMWQKGENDRMNWYDALKDVKKIAPGGYNDWRIPNIKELNTILDLSFKDNWWYFKEFFPAEGLKPPLLHYFSSTSFQNTYAWVTNFCYGYDGYYANKNATLLYRAVRNVEDTVKKVKVVFKLPATGQRKVYDDRGNVLKSLEKGDRFYGQDGCYGLNSLSYTKLRDKGAEIEKNVTWQQGLKMVKDNNTGLIWEVKSPNHNDFNYYNNKFSWQEAKLFIKELNKRQYGGFEDWRMPNKEELRTIVDYGEQDLTINQKYFPNTIPEFYWSSDRYEADPKLIWGIYFAYGCGIAYLENLRYSLRAVRAGVNDAFGNKEKYKFIDNDDGTITDLNTGLMWKKNESPPLNFEKALAYCENLELGGYNDWRLPDQKELATLLDLSYHNKNWFHEKYFPDTGLKPTGFYLSSSTFIDTFGWGINFQFGYDGYYADKKYGEYYFRPVRNVIS